MGSFYQQYPRHLLGIAGLSSDGHCRLTRGDHFHLFGGSRETHEGMQENVLHLTEALKKRGKTIITATDQEFYETALDLGISIFSPEKTTDLNVAVSKAPTTSSLSATGLSTDQVPPKTTKADDSFCEKRAVACIKFFSVADDN